MSVFNGKRIKAGIYGASRGEKIGVKISGLDGFSFDENKLKDFLKRRSPSDKVYSTARKERDIPVFSGEITGEITIENTGEITSRITGEITNEITNEITSRITGKITNEIAGGVTERKIGGEFSCEIFNEDAEKSDLKKASGKNEVGPEYGKETVKSKFFGIPRPSHADYTAFCKYHGYEDYRGGGHFSGRVTAGIVAAASIVKSALESIGINIATHIIECANVQDKPFNDIKNEILTVKSEIFPVIDKAQGKKMQEEIEKAKADGDSVGGVTETAIIGLPEGVGEPWFDSVESILSHALFSIGGIKGVEFGNGFEMTKMRGSAANDAFALENGKVVTLTNNNGGVNGGITNGMPVIFKCAVKPTPSIYKTQKTVNFLKNEETEINIRGRHDPAIIRRICPVIDAVAALAVADLLQQKYGTDVMTKGIGK